MILTKFIYLIYFIEIIFAVDYLGQTEPLLNLAILT